MTTEIAEKQTSGMFRLIITLSLNFVFLLSMAGVVLGQQKLRVLSLELPFRNPLFTFDSHGWKIMDGPPVGDKLSFRFSSYPNQPDHWGNLSNLPAWTTVLPGFYWCGREQFSCVAVRHFTWIMMVGTCIALHHRRFIARLIRRRSRSFTS